MSTRPVAVVIGVGLGLGSALARAFAAAGHDIGLVARTDRGLAALADELKEVGATTGWATADVTDDAALRDAVRRFADHAGRIDVLHYNPSALTMKSPLELSPAELLADVHLGVAGLLTAIQAARPAMSSGGRVTATGSVAADRPWAAAASLGVQKAGLRNLVAALDQTLAPDGIRAATVTVRGTIAAGTAFDPALIAAAVLAAASRPGPEWTPEVSFP